MIITKAETLLRRNWWSLFKQVRERYRVLDLGNKAASLSYYTIISLFPLLLLLVSLASFIVSPDLLMREVLNLSDQFFPYHSPLIDKNLRALFTQRQAFSWFGGITLFLSANALYAQLEQAINLLLRTEKRRHYLLSRAFAVLWLLGFMVVLMLPFSTRIFFKAFAWGIPKTFFPAFLSNLTVPFFGGVLICLTLFLVPTKRLKKRFVVIAGLIFSLILQVGRVFFEKFILVNLTMYNLVYGSLSSLILVVIWVYYFHSMFLLSIVMTRELSRRFPQSVPREEKGLDAMVLQQKIIDKMEKRFQPKHLEVINESYMHAVPRNAETHFKMILVADEFEGKSLLQRQRLVNELLGEERDSGLHALALHTFSPDEWQKKQSAASSPQCLGGSKGENS